MTKRTTGFSPQPERSPASGNLLLQPSTRTRVFGSTENGIVVASPTNEGLADDDEGYANAPAHTVSVGDVTYAYRESGPKGGVPVVFFAHLAAIQKFGRSAPSDLSKLSQPMLIANGDNDRVVASILSEDLHRRIAGSELIVHRDSGHVGIFQSREQFAPSRSSSSVAGRGQTAKAPGVDVGSRVIRYLRRRADIDRLTTTIVPFAAAVYAYYVAAVVTCVRNGENLWSQPTPGVLP